MKKAQMEILGSILLVGLILGSITAAYLWGLPLVNKSGDASRIDYAKKIFGKLADSFAKVAREGGQTSLKVQIDKGLFRLERDQANEYVLTYAMQTDMRFFSAQEMPVNDFNSPYAVKEGWLNATVGACPTPIAGLTCDKTGNLDLGDDGSYLICLCAGNVLNHNGVRYLDGQSFAPSPKYKVGSVDYASGAAGVSDGYRTVVGLLGVDPPGVILAKGNQAGNVYEAVLKLKLRKMFDPSNNEILELNLAGAKGSSTIGRGPEFTITMKNAGESLRTEQVEIAGKTGLRKVRSATIEISIGG